MRDALTLVAMLAGVPVNVLVRPVLFAADVESGAVGPTGPVDVLRGVLTGRSSQESRK